MSSCLPEKEFNSENGKMIEGVGVDPDININHTQKSLLSGLDQQMETVYFCFTNVKKRG